MDTQPTPKVSHQPEPAALAQRKQTKRTARGEEDQLTIRWFTPRGRAALSELVDDLLHGEGRHVGVIVAELRREGALADAADLRGIDLRGLDLANAQLPGADLRGARLAGANLRRANLRGACLERAVLRGAKLKGADLRGASLERSDLRDADLSDTNMEEAKLAAAKMRGAEIKRAWVRGVDFEQAFTDGVDLSLLRRKPYCPPRSSARLRDGIGAPPGSEPVPMTQRLRAPAPRRAPPARVEQPRRRLRTGSATLDEALAQILLRRGEVEQVVVRFGDQEVVLFGESGEPSLRHVA